MGASGSSQIRAHCLVPVGASFQANGGETSSPSSVYFVGIGCPFSKAALVIAMPCVADFIVKTPSDERLRDESGARPVLGPSCSWPFSCEVQEASANRAVEKAISTKRWLNRFVAIIGPPSVSLYRRRQNQPALFDDRRDPRERRS